MASSKWLDRQVTQLRAHLSEFGLVVPVEQAGLLITERVESVATLMRITPQTARRHFDPLALAESIAASLQDERPGEDMFDLARDTTLALPLLGRCIAGLAEAINVRIVNETPATAITNIGDLAGSLSTLGQFTAGSDEADWDQARVRVPRAFVLRLIRNLEAAADIVETGTAPSGLAAHGVEGASRLAKTFRADAQLLRAVETAARPGEPRSGD